MSDASRRNKSSQIYPRGQCSHNEGVNTLGCTWTINRTGLGLDSLTTLFERKILPKTRTILDSPSHDLDTEAICFGEERAESEGKAFNLQVNLCPNPQLFS